MRARASTLIVPGRVLVSLPQLIVEGFLSMPVLSTVDSRLVNYIDLLDIVWSRTHAHGRTDGRGHQRERELQRPGPGAASTKRRQRVSWLTVCSFLSASLVPGTRCGRSARGASRSRLSRSTRARRSSRRSSRSSASAMPPSSTCWADRDSARAISRSTSTRASRSSTRSRRWRASPRTDSPSATRNDASSASSRRA